MYLRVVCVAALAAFSLVAGVSGGQPAAADPAAVPDVAVLSVRLDAVLQEGVMEKVYPGAALIVGQPGRRLYARAVGQHTYEPDSPSVTLTTIWDLASVSKVVGTATAAMVAVEDGKLRLDDPVSAHIPGFSAGNKGAATVRNLMTHTSGLPAYLQSATVEKNRRPDESQADALIRNYAALTARYDPGTSYTYSCLNMQATARIVENAMGARMEDLLRMRVYGPLGMNDTVYVLRPGMLERTAPSVQTKNGPMRGVVHDPLASYHKSDTRCPGNAGLFSTAEDLARYCEMILNHGRGPAGQVLKPDTVDLMTSVQSPRAVKSLRGLGWDVYTEMPWATPLNDTTDTLAIGHTGYTGTLIWLDKKTRTYVVFLTNRTFPDDATKPKDKPNITAQRRAVLETVLRSMPVYAGVFKQ